MRGNGPPHGRSGEWTLLSFVQIAAYGAKANFFIKLF